MGLDIYVGSFTRYYSRNWKNIVQLLSERYGHKSFMIDQDCNKIKPLEDIAEIEQIHESVCQWAENIAKKIKLPAQTPLWDENFGGDYFTDKPDWEAYNALAMLQACMLLNRPLPKYVKTGWNASDEPSFKDATSLPITKTIISNVKVWLPIYTESIFITLSPTGDEIIFSSVSLLKKELEELNRHMWNANEDTINSWRDDKFYIPVGKKLPELFLGFLCGDSRQKEKYRTEELAQCAFSMMYQAVKFAEEHNLPIILDF